MHLKTYEIGKAHFWQGIDITAMDHADRDHKISWLAGYLDAALERKIIRYNLSRANEKHATV